MKMKSISLLLCIILFIFSPSILLAKQVCIAPSGCKIEMDTGHCPKCIEVDEQPIIKEEKVVVIQKPVVKIPPKKKPLQIEVSKTNKKKGVCYVKPCDWLDTPSKVSKSKPKRDCSQRWECVVPPCDFIDADGCLIGD